MRRTWIGIIIVSILLAVGCAGDRYYSRGRAHDKKCNFDLAITEYSKAIELRPGWEIFYVARGNAYDNNGNFDEAIKDYNKAIELNPTFAWAYKERGVAYAGNGYYERAIRDFNIALKLDPKNASAYKSRGNTFFYQGRFDLAGADYRACLIMKPWKIYTMLWLYIAQERAGKSGLHELSANAKNAKLGKWPGPLVSLFLEGISPEELLEETKHKDQRVEKHRQCEAYFYLGQYYLLKVDKEKAAQMFKLCLETNVTHYVENTGAKVELERMDLE